MTLRRWPYLASYRKHACLHSKKTEEKKKVALGVNSVEPVNIHAGKHYPLFIVMIIDGPHISSPRIVFLPLLKQNMKLL